MFIFQFISGMIFQKTKDILEKWYFQYKVLDIEAGVMLFSFCGVLIVADM